jgi:hypothetical protein
MRNIVYHVFRESPKTADLAFERPKQQELACKNVFCAVCNSDEQSDGATCASSILSYMKIFWFSLCNLFLGIRNQRSTLPQFCFPNRNIHIIHSYLHLHFYEFLLMKILRTKFGELRKLNFEGLQFQFRNVSVRNLLNCDSAHQPLLNIAVTFADVFYFRRELFLLFIRKVCFINRFYSSDLVDADTGPPERSSFCECNFYRIDFSAFFTIKINSGMN